jgi:hypothetical protein
MTRNNRGFTLVAVTVVMVLIGIIAAVLFAQSISTDPINERDLFLTADELGLIPANNWLNDGPWAVRLEVERNLVQNARGNFDYSLRLWMRQCTQAGCNDILGIFFPGHPNQI